MSRTGTNHEETRPYNRSVVLETVRLNQPISRAEIARQTGLTPQAVSKIILDLEGIGLLRRGGRRRTSRGQPPVEIALNPEGAYTVGIELHHGGLRALLVDLSGHVRSRRDVVLHDPVPTRAVPTIIGAVLSLVAAAAIDPCLLMGIGLVLPGPLSQMPNDRNDPTTIPGWTSRAPAAEIAAQLELPVLVDNDATAASIGERLYGAAARLQNYIYIFIGAGLGAGLILDGQPVKGSTGNAGELGHLVVDPGGRPCYCGNRGCLERYVSLQALAERYGEAGLPMPAIETIDKDRMICDPVLSAWLAEAAAKLRLAIGAVETLLDPETVLIGGHLPGLLVAGLIERLSDLPPSITPHADRITPRLIAAEAGPDVSALGAAALPIFDTFSPSLHRRRKTGGVGHPPPPPRLVAIGAQE